MTLSHPTIRRLAAIGTTVAAVAAVGAPNAHAVSKTDKKQNAAIKKVQKAGKKVDTKASAAKSAAASAASAAKAASTAAAAADKKGADAATAIATLSAKVDAIVTTAMDSLTKLSSAVSAQEYGVVQVQLGTNDVSGAILTSSDIPDDTNGTTVSGDLIVPVPANTSAAAITIQAGIRSGESDGTGASLPAGQAGLVSVIVNDGTGGGVTVGGGNPGLPNVPLTSKPNATYNNAPLYDITNKSPRVDATPNPLSLPNGAGQRTDLTAAARLATLSAAPGPYTVTTGAAAGVVIVHLTVRFHDLQASADDPTA